MYDEDFSFSASFNEKMGFRNSLEQNMCVYVCTMMCHQFGGESFKAIFMKIFELWKKQYFKNDRYLVE